MTPAEQKVIDAARQIVLMGPPDVAGFLFGRGWREEGHAVVELVHAMMELEPGLKQPTGGHPMDATRYLHDMQSAPEHPQ